MTRLIVPASFLLTVPEGASQLPLVELDKTTVRTKHKRVVLPRRERSEADCSYGMFDDTLQFTAWEMFHAAKKSELTRSFTPRRAVDLGILMAHEHFDHFVWDEENFRCADGSCLWLEDFSRTGLAGRIGEAIAYLTMVKLWGYVYWDRVATVLFRAAYGSQIRHSEMVKVTKFIARSDGGAIGRQPDFVFEKNDGFTSLMEAKGSFVSPDIVFPDVKSPLKDGLEQLDAWASLISPAPRSSIAIGTFLREASDPSTDRSMILHVDPPPPRRSDIEPVKLPADQLRRNNYGAWLAEMGLSTSGAALIARRESRTTRTLLPVATIEGRKFALSIMGWRTDRRQLHPSPWLPFVYTDMPWRHQASFLRDIGIDGVFAVGLETSLLRVVERAIGTHAAEILNDLRSPMAVAENGGRQAGGFYGSIMPDGSLMGVIAGDLLAGLEMEEFTL